MVTDEERDYMYEEYANDPLMQLNLGIRRRLAPLLENGRDEIELMHAMLFSLPGSPVLYYGDEIGMGDNILPRRSRRGTHADALDGRSQRWLLARRFRPAYLPPLMDPVYGFQAVTSRPSCARPRSCCAGSTASSRYAKSTRYSASGATSRSIPRTPVSSPTSPARG